MALSAKKLAQLAEAAIEKGGKAISDFEKILEKQGDEVLSDFERIMQGNVKPVPRKPVGQPIPKPSAKPEPAPKTKAEPVPLGTPKEKREETREDEKGVVKIADVVRIVDEVEDGKGGFIETLFEIFPLADVRKLRYADPGADEKTKFDRLSKPDKIKAAVRKARLFPDAARYRQKLKVPEEYPGTDSKLGKPYPQPDIMRRGEGDKPPTIVLERLALMPLYCGGPRDTDPAGNSRITLILDRHA